MKVFYFELIISILLSFQQNYNKEEQMKLDYIKKQINASNFENAVFNITNLFQNQLINLTGKINDLIKSGLENQEQIIAKAESEQLLIRDMLSEINVLKKRYKRNMIISYVIGVIILCTFFIFCYSDHLNKRKTRKYAGYKNPVSDNENNQIDIE